jgi:hypothetical protein
MSRPANPSPWPRPGSPAWSQPATVQRASPRLRRCAKGGGGRTAWRSKRKPCTRSCGHASRRRAKCRARATPQQPEAIPAFQATGQEQLQRALPSTNTRPVRVCSPDERRVGLLTIRRRRLTARGVRPGGSVPQVFAWFYVYGAVEPATGERFFLGKRSPTRTNHAAGHRDVVRSLGVGSKEGGGSPYHAASHAAVR